LIIQTNPVSDTVSSFPPVAQAAARVLIADDHPLVVRGLQALLEEHREFTVIGCCYTGAQTLEAVDRHRPDLLILDLNMPDMDGLEVARRVQALEHAPRIVLLTAQIDEDQLIESLRVGVRGVVLKEMAPKLLVTCLRRVEAGGQWLEKESAARAMSKLVRREAKARELAALLTPRELEVTRLVASGRTNKEIAAQLFIAEGTVKIHLHNIFEKTAVSRRAELVRLAQEYALA
jgi:DNA-binding NarL/FixJ family response regulator